MPRASLSNYDIEIIINSSYSIAKKCVELDLSCRDPPAVTTGVLYSLGYIQYHVRRFWRNVRDSLGNYTLYKYHDAFYELSLGLETDGLYYLPLEDLAMPLDPLDKELILRKRMDYEFAPRAYQLYVYVEGYYHNHITIRINLIRILTFLIKYHGQESLDYAIHCVKQLVWKQDKSCLQTIYRDIVLDTHIHGILGVVLPKVPRSFNELLLVSPLIRRVL